MADIKLYGKIHNQDGNLLVSPLEVAGVNTDGSIPEGAATSENNIVSYINEKIKGVNTNVGNIKTGIESVTVSNGTFTPLIPSTSITVTAKDGSSDTAYIELDGSYIVRDANIIYPTINPKFGVMSTLATLRMQKWDGAYIST